MNSPAFLPSPRVLGPRLSLRPASGEDAAFVLSLRLDSEKGKYLSATDPDLDVQAAWIQRSARDPAQNYFIIEGEGGRSCGTVRLYDPQHSSFCWGSWILTADRPPSAAVESTLLVYMYGLFCGFDRSHFDVRRDNVKVWQYHERMGANRIRETEDDFYYEMTGSSIAALLRRLGERAGGEFQIVSPEGSQPRRVTIEELLSADLDRVTQ